MNRTHRNWTVPVSGALLFTTAVSAEQDLQTYLNSTNRVTLSVRFGMNIKGGFKGISGVSPSSFTKGFAAPNRLTPNGDFYNYQNGYVLTDISGNAGNQTWYWGYDNSSQVNFANNTISFDRTTMGNVPNLGNHNSGDDDLSHLGFEIAYNYEIGQKEEWRHLRYGLEIAANWMPITLDNHGSYSVARMMITDTYSYTPGTTPPGYNVPGELPYQGTFQGPNFVLNVPAKSLMTKLPGAQFLVQQHFDGNLWGFRLGPYLEMPLSKHWSLHLSGGLAVGVIEGDGSWSENFSVPGAGGVSRGGGGSDTDLLWGYYIDLQAQYQFNNRWGLEAGVQLQDLGTYNHSFGGSKVELDFSKSVFVHAGISFSF
jgi:hypothetical protein